MTHDDPAVAAAVARTHLSPETCAELIAAGIDFATITGEELLMVLCDRRARLARRAARDRRTRRLAA